MATFPTTVPWDATTQWDEKLGINAIEMESGIEQTQTYIATSPAVVTISLVHRRLTSAVKDQVVDFLRANPKEFNLVDPTNNVTYLGSMVSDGVARALEKGGTLWRLRWRFNGQAVP